MPFRVLPPRVLGSNVRLSPTCGPSGLLGEASRNLRRLPQPRLLRVSVPVTLLVPSAYRHSAYISLAACT